MLMDARCGSHTPRARTKTGMRMRMRVLRGRNKGGCTTRRSNEITSRCFQEQRERGGGSVLTTVVTPPPPEGCGHDVVMDKETTTTTTTTTTTRREARAEARTSRIQKVRIKISGQWYDCSRWAAAHPGGARFLHAVDGKDVTNLFYALHSFGAKGSTRAVELLQRLPTCNAPEAETMESEEHENEKVCAPFDALRRKLADEGWFERCPREEAIALGGVAALCICGTLIARVGSASPLAQILATLFIGLGMQQAGWLGHDYIHGRG